MKIKITDHRKPPKQVRFSDIEQGVAFLDCNGDFALKVSPTQWYSFRHNMLMEVDDERFQNLPLTVVKAEMIITESEG